MTEASENNVIEFSPQDEADLLAMGVRPDGEEPVFHPILMVWQKVLEPAEAEASTKVTPQWANKMVQTHTGLKFSDMNHLRDLYFGKIADLKAILAAVIESDSDCLSYTTPEEDKEHNSTHYLNLLLDWQCQFLQWELDWDTMQDDAAVELAALSEVHKMFFASDGLVAHLEYIQFEFGEAEQALLVEALDALREE